MRFSFSICLLLFFVSSTNAQDTSVIYENKKITLPEVVVRNNLDYKAILQRIKNDTTFYKAFRTLHIVQYGAYNDIRILDKKGNVKATYNSKTFQQRANECRTMRTDEEKSTGDFFNKNGEYNYTTGEMYASIFFTPKTICGEDNIVAGKSFSTAGKSGTAKHKEQLKMLFFNPGKKIPGIPFIGNKLDLYDEDAGKLYNYRLEYIDYKGSYAWLFSIKPKEDLALFKRDDIVVDEMSTWFDYKTMEVLARNYVMSYKTGAYHFNVNIEVEMTHVGGMLVPQTMRYKGDFGVLFKKRESGEFTATLFNFSK